MHYLYIIVFLTLKLDNNNSTLITQKQSRDIETQARPRPGIRRINRKQTGNFWADRFGIIRHPETDTIGNKPAKFYLKNQRVAQIAKDFYMGRFNPKDNDSTTYLLSLATKNNLYRPFYRWCLDQTIIIADGALGEYPGKPALEYAMRYPNEFFAYMDKDKSRKRYKRWVEIISYSGLLNYNTENPITLKKILIRQLNVNCNNCSMADKRKINKLAYDVVEGLKALN